jgi:hypothetical protein
MHNGGIAHFRQVQRPLLATLSQQTQLKNKHFDGISIITS